VIHRSEKEIVSHHCVKENLKDHGIPNRLVDEVANSTLAILGEEKILVSPVHPHHGEKEC
jgi:hypothetical protein